MLFNRLLTMTGGGIITVKTLLKLVTVLAILKGAIAPMQWDKNAGATMTTQTVTENTDVQITLINQMEVKGENGDVSWSLSPNCKGMFTINVDNNDDDEADFVLIGSPDYETMPLWICVVSVTDEDGTVVTMNVTIPIKDISDEPPTFSQSVYQCVAIEESVKGTSVTGCNITFVDREAADTQFCTMTGTHQAYFHVETYITPSLRWCEISVADKYDREFIPQSVPGETLNIQVKVTDQGGFSTEARVDVTIGDINDNAPVCLPDIRYYYVDDNAANAYVSTMGCTDPDKGVNAQITYSIQGGNAANEFTLDPASGILTVTAPLGLDYDTISPNRELLIWAVDGGDIPFTTTLTIKVIVKPINEADPVWGVWLPALPTAAGPYTSVDENMIPGTVIFHVNATDTDYGVHGLIFYSIVSATGVSASGGSTDLSSSFTIDFEGRVHKRGPLIIDAEKYQTLNFEIRAEDGGGGFVTQVVDVTINDINEFGPVFPALNTITAITEAYNASPVHNFVGLLDPDISADTNFSCIIISGNGRGKFVIDPVVKTQVNTAAAGPIIDSPTLDPMSYELAIECRDHGGVAPYKATIATLMITVTPSNDFTPTITGPTALTLPEDNPTGVVANFLVGDKDTGNFGKYTCTINPGNTPFIVTSDCTQLIQESPLDFETTTSYALVVTITDSGGLTATHNVAVTVTNVPDVMPVCLPISNTVTIVEHDAVGTSLLTITCTDADETTAPLVNLALLNEASLPFALSAAGVLTIKSDIDYDCVGCAAKYALVARGTDKSVPSIFTNVYITVYVTPKDDGPPVFPASPTVLFAEDNPPGTVVTTFTASDIDKAPHKIKSYAITTVSNGGAGKFEIDDIGGIRVSATTILDFDTMSATDHSYVITVTANDGTTITTSSVTVTITDVNDNWPIFTQSVYTGTIEEDTIAAGTTTGITVSATDADQLDTTMAYSLATNGDPNFVYFQIDPASGLITRSATTGLIYNNIKKVTFNVLAKDRTTGIVNTGTSMAVVLVTDRNNFVPVCTSGPTVVLSKAENLALGTVIYDLGTVCSDGDKDQVPNYTVTSASPYFNVDALNGQMYLVQKMDKEGTDSQPYIVVVEVSDQHPTDPKTTTITMRVQPLNIDEAAPVCTGVNPAVSFPESTTSTTQVFTMGTCTDLDAGTNLEYTISTMDGNPGTGPFVMDAATGKVTLGSAVDYELKTDYKLVVKIKDKVSNPSLYTTTYTIDVQILPVNEYPPVITTSSTTASYPEGTPVGTEVVLATSLSATDADDYTPHKTIYWEIVSGNTAGYFTIDRYTGKIQIAKPLDFEAASLVTLGVQAVDGGGLRSAVIEQVAISITDVNDNTPIFSASSQTVSIIAGTAAPITLVDFTSAVTDADSGVNKDWTLSLDTGGGVFQVVGNLLQTVNVMSNSSRTYITTVKAIDHGTAPKTATATVTVVILPNNVNPPVLGNSASSLNEDTAIGTAIATVVGSDLDPGVNGYISYSITSDTSGGSFTIDPVAGIVYLIKPLDHETAPGPLYVTVTGTDGGNPAKTDSMVLTVTVLDVNDNDPQFKPVPDNTFAISIPESPGSALNDWVTHIAYSDADQSGTAMVHCSIAFQTAGNYFAINNVVNCNMTIANLLDREVSSKLDVLVQLTDLTPTVRTSKAMYTITVTDVNDNAPDFGSLSGGITAGLVEGDSAGTFVAQTPAFDIDESGSNSQVSYVLAGAESGYFQIDSDGKITVKTAVDREMYPSINLTVKAMDAGSPTALTSTMTVSIIVMDINDNPPIITGSPYKMSIPEDVGIGVTVANVIAKDADSTWGVITYAITAGDTAAMFEVTPGGVVRTLKTGFDRETLASYNLMVTVSDNGTPTPSSVNALVMVTITDINDNAPVVPLLPITVTVMENSPVGSPVSGTLGVTDPDDEPLNNLLTYYMDAVIVGPDYFTINSSSGVITVKTALLDREKTPYSILRIRVSDAGTPNLTSTVTVTVSLVDENDNSPVFTSNYFNATIPESTAVGTAVLTLTATDIDTGANAAIVYSLKNPSSPAASFYSVNSATGVIYVNSALDYETNTFHTFEVLATDSGVSVQRSSSATVYIAYTDVNDVAPSFSPSFISSEVPLADQGVMEIAYATHVDPDTGVGGTAQYSWTTTVTHFTLDSTTGLIQRNPNEDLTLEKIYLQYISATDQGVPSLTSSSPLTVRIDTFPVENFTVAITFSKSLTDFYLYKTQILKALSQVMSSKYPENRMGLWTAVDTGSSVVGYFYGVQNLNADKIENIAVAKAFIPKADLLKYMQFDSTGQPTAALLSAKFANATITLVEGYPDPVLVPWYETVPGIVGIVLGTILGAALLAGLIYACVSCARTGCPGAAAKVQAPAAKTPAQTFPESRSSKLLELNKDKHPKKVEPKRPTKEPENKGEDDTDPRPKSSNKTRVVNQDIADKLYDPDSGKLHTYDVPTDSYNSF